MQGRVVLVTGATKGIGKEVARQLAGLGATVLVGARDADHARAAAKELSLAGDVRALPVDLAAARQVLEVNLVGPWRLTDALLVATAERLGVHRIATFDRRPIAVFRPSHVRSFDLEP